MSETRARAEITVEVQDLVAIVEIHRPPHNFFDFELIRGLADRYQTIDADPRARAIVLCSEGSAFCAGANFAARAQWSEERLENQAGVLYQEAVRLFRAKTPVIAAVQGAAVGGGLGLALSADFRVAAPEARFAANFVRLGLHPGFGLTHTLARAIGRTNAELMLLTGRRVKGEEALAMGLVQELVPLAELRTRAIDLAREIAHGAPLSIDAIRASQRGDLAERVAAATAEELAIQTRLKQTADFAEGVAAMSERRVPQFRGQ
jgi:enoyl-CoA hydratase/carnithine racemase